MEVRTLRNGYSPASDEASITDGCAKPVNTKSLHQRPLDSSLHSHHSSSSTDEAPHNDNASLIQSPRHCRGSQCVDEASMAATLHQTGTFFNKKFMIPIHLGWTLEGDVLGEYFGLAMAVCAVGLLRNACLGSEMTNTRFSKEATLSMVGQGALAPLELLTQRSTAEAKQRRETQEAYGKAEQSRLLQKIDHLERELLELKRLRSEDGKANERVVSIFASKEQAWKAERRKFRDDQQMLCQELQRAYLQQEALSLKLEHLRSLQKQPCSECERREGIVAELKERFGEQEFLTMATMEEAQIEQQEKNALAEKLASVESSLCQMQEKLSVKAEEHALELAAHREFIEQLQIRIKEAEAENSHVSQELRAVQASISTLIHEKTRCEEHNADMSTEVTQLKRSVQGKDDIISAMLKKARADNEDRKELEREVTITRAKLFHAVKEEKEKWKRLVEADARSSLKTENFRSRSSFGSRPVANTKDMIEELQKLHDVEIKSLQSTYEEQVQMLQKRLGLYQERIADLEEDILLRMTDAKRMITYKEHDSLNHAEIMDNKCMVIFKESVEAELATKEFQLSVAKTLIKQFMDSEAHREQEIENWKNLYLASKDAIGIHREQEHAGAIVPRNPKLHDRLELEKSRYAIKVEQRHWQEINAFERQMKARDERMEAFRWQLLHMEEEVQRSRRQIEALKQSLENANEENRRLDGLLKEEKDKFLACRNKDLVSYTKCACDEEHEEEVCSLQEKVSALQALLTEKEMEYEQSLIRASAEADSELQDRDCKLAVAEAQLIQAHIIFDAERKEREKLFLELQKEKSALEHYFNTNLNNETKNDVPAMSYKACLALRRLSSRIHEAQAKASAASPGDSMDDEHVKELVEQSVQYFSSNPEVNSIKEEPGYVSKIKSGKAGNPQELVDDGLTVDKFVAEVWPSVVV